MKFPSTFLLDKGLSIVFSNWLNVSYSALQQVFIDYVHVSLALFDFLYDGVFLLVEYITMMRSYWLNVLLAKGWSYWMFSLMNISCNVYLYTGCTWLFVLYSFIDETVIVNYLLKVIQFRTKIKKS